MQPDSRRRGEMHHRAKYPDTVVALVRALQAEGLGYVRIAKRLAMNAHWVRDVCDGTIRQQQQAQAASA